MAQKHKIAQKIAFAFALGSIALAAQAVTVNSTYINKTATEIRGVFGSMASPTVYIDQRACGEQGASDARACGPYIISVGTKFLQTIESTHGNYAAKAVMGHEWGHSIQFTRNIYQPAPYMELQADCAGGAFVKYAEKTLRYSPFLAAAVSSARYYAGGDHGTPAQRDYYTRYGYASTTGVAKCYSNLPRV